MAEVADWSPIDDDNNSAPPVGAPEGMMPSAVNNTMRAMMGSLRRNHDTIVAGTTALPYLPTAGGVVSGNVAINGTGGLALGATQLRNISSALEVYNAGGGGISSRGPGAAVVFCDQNQVSPAWAWLAVSGVAYLNASGGTTVSVTPTGVLTTPGGVNTSDYEISGVPFAQRSGDNAHQILDADGQLALALYGAAGGNANYYRADTHNFQNNAGTSTASLNSAGTWNVTLDITAGRNIGCSGTITGNTITATGTVSGNAVYSSGDLTAVGTITGATVSATGTVSGNLITGNVVSSNSHMNAASYNLRGNEFAAQDAANTYNRISDPGGANITLFASGDNYYDNVQHFFRSRGGISNYCFFHGGGTFNVSGSWNVISDDTVKTNVAPYTAGLAEIRQLNPVSFEYTSGAALRGAAGTTNYGLMASEVQPVIPEMVSEVELDVDGVPTPTQTLTPTHLTYVLITACKELAVMNEQLAARIAALEGGA